MLDTQEARALLTKLKVLDPEYRIFGAASHQYLLHPTLSDAEIRSFEMHYKITLPEVYRAFLTEIGNGGAGPAYGIFKLGEQDLNHGHCKWDEGYLIGDLSKPFIHQDAWNLPESFWQQEPMEEGLTEDEFETLWDEWHQRLIETNYNPGIMNGAIPICHLGCALRVWLVIKGEQTGNVWLDERADNKGISPIIITNNQPASFASWYEHWLDTSLEGLNGGSKMSAT